MSSENETKKEKKQLRAKLLEQLEFYFSDSNLAKDRFLKQEIHNSQDGFIDVDLFLKFNKIRTLTSDSKQITKALKHSELLELNESKTKVRRKIQFVEPSEHEVEKRTIYVENLPSNISNDKLKKLFKSFGEISYISLPKFKSSFQSKGFAFIEFKEKSSAKNALKHFSESDSTKSIEGKFPKSNPKIVQLEKQIKRAKELLKSHDVESKQHEVLLVNEDEVKLDKKRKLNQNEEDQEEHENKKKKINDEALLESFKVISKKEWLKLREEFLRRQKEEIDNLKAELAKLDEQLKEKIAQEQQAKHPNIKTDDITRGCVVKLVLRITNESNEYDGFKLSRQQFKTSKIPEEFHSQIAYIDMQKNANRIFIRCNTSEEAQTIFRASTFLPEFEKTLLEGLEETEYFERIYSNRNKKLEKKAKKETSTKKVENELNNSNKIENTDKRLKNEFSEMKISGKKEADSKSKSSHVIFGDD